jgi:hypothetical protein
MLKTLPILSAILLLILTQASASPETDYIDQQIALIQADFGIQVQYQYDPLTFFPTDWQQPALALSAVEIDVAEATRLLPIIRQFLETHPEPVIRADLENIYLLRELSFKGKPYGGTHRDKNMYIVCDGVQNRFDDAFMLRRLHSEFSSILLEYHTFPTNSWVQLNPLGFTYSGNGFEMVDHPARYDSTDRSCSDGFLIHYCRSSVQNDFNIVSAWLFTQKSELDTLSQQHYRLQEKQDVAEQFYTTLSGEYSFD